MESTANIQTAEKDCANLIQHFVHLYVMLMGGTKLDITRTETKVTQNVVKCCLIGSTCLLENNVQLVNIHYILTFSFHYILINHEIFYKQQSYDLKKSALYGCSIFKIHRRQPRFGQSIILPIGVHGLSCASSVILGVFDPLLAVCGTKFGLEKRLNIFRIFHG